MVELNLEQRGHHVAWLRSAEPALETGPHEFDAILLDLMLPGMDGLELASRLRQRGVGTPILMMTVRGELETKVEALEGGIDDYLTKPFEMDELVARLRALIRRSQAASQMPASGRLRLAGGELIIESLTYRSADGAAHALSQKETDLLAFLARHAGRTLSRADIIDEVWGMDAVPTERTVDNFILRLRRLIENDPEAPRHLITVRGRGYRFDP
jgi:DNA-binding response OmpR family regulator